VEIRIGSFLVALLILSACSRDPAPTQAEASSFSVQNGPAGPTPFIAFLNVRALGLDAGGTIQWTVQSQPGSTAPPVSARYSYAALASRGYATNAESLTVPVHGLYAGVTNQVSVTATFADGSTADALVSVDAPPISRPAGSTVPRRGRSGGTQTFRSGSATTS